MIIDLFEISDPVFDFNVEISPADIDLEEDTARIEKPVRIAGSLSKKIAQVDIAGNISAEIEIDCTRCLSPTETTLDFPFKVVYVTQENYTQNEEAELRAEDLEVAIFEGDKIDLSGLAREQILLNLPTRFLCRENCRGLCPKCGANRNAVNCNCEEKELDPRWQGLRDLKN